MPVEPEIGLVGRDSLVALTEHLVERRSRRPLPIVVAFGPGGSGKTELLRHLEDRYRAAAPVAYVDLDRAGSGAVRAILDVAYGCLDGYANRRFGTLRLPRYALARAALAAEPRPGDTISQARELIGTRLRGLSLFADALGDAAQAAPRSTPLVRLAGRLLRPFIRQLVMLAVVLPTGLRRLFGAKGTALSWFEKVAGPELLQVPARRVDEVIAELWKTADGRDRPSRVKVDRLLVRAFLADLKAAYRWQRHRRVNALFLLDDADLLPGAESRHPVSEEAGTDVLDLLAEARRKDPEIPLLVVAAKQATTTMPDLPLGPPRSDPAEAAKAWYDAWHDAYRTRGDLDAVYLTARLAPFTPDQTRQLLSLWNDFFHKTAETKALVEQLQEITHGHPLAVRALYRRDRVVSSPRRLLSEELAWNDGSGQWGQNLGGYLRWRFLQRLEGLEPLDPAAARSGGPTGLTGGENTGNGRSTQNFLARLAAPLRLDAPVIQVLTGLPADEADRLLARLAAFSFADSGFTGSGFTGSGLTDSERHGEQADRAGDAVNRPAGGHGLTLHPLLRDLLVPILVAQQEPDGDPSYLAVHATLRDHFRGLPGGEDAYLYHCLALGDTHEVAERLRRRLSRGGRYWLPLLTAAAQAPIPDRERPRWRTWLQDRFGRHVVDRIARPELLRVEELVEAMWAVRSCTSTEPRTPRLYGRVLAAFQDLVDHREVQREDRDVYACVARYERNRQALIDESPAEKVADPPAYCRPRAVYPYPPVWPPRHFFRRTALVASVALLLGYAGVYGYHGLRYCNTPSPLAPRTVLGESLGSRVRLTEMDGQCIGISDRPGYFTEQEDLSPGEREVAVLSQLIDNENREVLEQVQGGDGRFKYVTVVVATMLSSAEEAQRDLSAGVNELRGAYLAQRNWNELHIDDDKPDVLVRLVLANFGGNSKHAETVADQIRELVERDPTVVAVTGMGQTREDTVLAAKSLGGDIQSDGGVEFDSRTGVGEGIPMVGSALSGNDFTGLPYFVRTAPSNRRQVEAITRFIESRPKMRDRTPYVLIDEGDPYSRDLADDFADTFLASENASDAADPGGTTSDEIGSIDQEPPEPGSGPPLVEVPYISSTSRTVRSFEDRTAEICRREDEPLLVYTGRASEVSSLLSRLFRSRCGKDALVVGADDLSQLETENFAGIADPEYASGRLFYATFAPSEEAWHQIAPQGLPPGVRDFFDTYRSVRRESEPAGAFRSPPNGHIMLAYDAVSLVVRRASTAGPDATRQEVFEHLRETRRFQGVSGVIRFERVDEDEPARGSDPIDKLVVFQQVVLDTRPEDQQSGQPGGRLAARHVGHQGRAMVPEG